jgi:hypothetical protein
MIMMTIQLLLIPQQLSRAMQHVLDHADMISYKYVVFLS